MHAAEACILLVLLGFPVVGRSQASGGAASQATVSTSAPAGEGDHAARPTAGVLVDQVVAVVNDDLILESDIDQDRRFQAFQFLRAQTPYNRDAAVEQLVNRALILQQAKFQPDSQPTPAEVDAQIATLRKEIPACKQYDCESDAGWQRFVQAQGFTLAELRARIAQQLTILKFTEMRFRTGIRIDPSEIQNYYQHTLLPEYARLHATAPKVAVISDRIQQILLEQKISSLLNDWLQSLKAQGSVRIMRPGEVQP